MDKDGVMIFEEGMDENVVMGFGEEHEGEKYEYPIGVLAKNVKESNERQFVTKTEKNKISKIDDIERSFQNGCNIIVAGCTTYGAAPKSNSPSDIVDAIKKIYEDRYRAGYQAGYQEGYNIGYKEGYDQGKEEAMIVTSLSANGTGQIGTVRTVGILAAGDYKFRYVGKNFGLYESRGYCRNLDTGENLANYNNETDTEQDIVQTFTLPVNTRVEVCASSGNSNEGMVHCVVTVTKV